MVRFPRTDLPAQSAESPWDLRPADASGVPRCDAHDALFQFVGRKAPSHPGPWFLVAALLHLSIVTGLVLVSIFWPEPFDEPAVDPIQVLIYDPPPPPPPPLPVGSAQGGRPVPQKRPEPAPVPTPAPVLPSETALVAPVERAPVGEGAGLVADAFGSPNGSPAGVPEGMEEGVEGGVVGGIPGGVVGGVIGGTGKGPVPVRSVDRPPRLLRQVRPVYPSEAFIKRVEGTVVLELVVDEQGHVARTRTLQSVPLLDEAAVDAVRQWVFAPAEKGGRAVAVIVMAPVTFRIF